MIINYIPKIDPFTLTLVDDFKDEYNSMSLINNKAIKIMNYVRDKVMLNFLIYGVAEVDLNYIKQLVKVMNNEI